MAHEEDESAVDFYHSTGGKGEKVMNFVYEAADIDLMKVARGKFDLDMVGYYARPDVFQLMVNEKPALTMVLTT